MQTQPLHDGWSPRAIGDPGEAPAHGRGRDIPAAELIAPPVFQCAKRFGRRKA